MSKKASLASLSLGKSEEGEPAKEILIEFMKDFQKRNPYWKKNVQSFGAN